MSDDETKRGGDYARGYEDGKRDRIDMPTDWQLEQLFNAVHEHGEFGREWRERARQILAGP